MSQTAAGEGARDTLVAAFAEELALRDPDGSRAAALAGADVVVEQAVARLLDASMAWGEHLGPVYDVRGVQEILGVTKQAVSKRRLLALTTSSGRVVYPAFQFTARGVVPGLPEVVAMLDDSLVSPWTVASWLVSPSTELDSAAPIEVLASGETGPVLALAAAWARALAA